MNIKISVGNRGMRYARNREETRKQERNLPYTHAWQRRKQTVRMIGEKKNSKKRIPYDQQIQDKGQRTHTHIFM